MTKDPLIRLEHGSGGALSRDLVESVIYPAFSSDAYAELSDASPLEPGSDMVLTTDGYVVDPPFFPGGDIGRLCVFGTCNDLAVCGARPVSLSLAVIVEEGFSVKQLQQAMESAARAAQEANTRIITGDTKVVPRGKGGGLFLTTAGVGARVFPHRLSPSMVRPGDAAIVSGPLGAHGITIMAAREHLPVGDTLKSDTAFLYPLASALFPLGESLRFMRDATRGGVAAVLNEAAHGASWGIEVEEDQFPVSQEVRAVCDLLGLNPLEIANEGVFVTLVAGETAERALGALQSLPEGRQARVVGRVTTTNPGSVVMITSIGGKRILDFPRGLLLPRIC
ncbi:MAG TPA: hydrogenase expression/formation protein HypE [Spirochaetia bacterium]|nr:hydrogenase expression/formation protein HypE [Spirochaetia bacterium]